MMLSGVTGTHTYIYTHLEVCSRSTPPARLLANGAEAGVCVCVCVSPPLPRAESFKPQNKRGPDGGESSILKCF